jgi:hypothetical protein
MRRCAPSCDLSPPRFSHRALPRSAAHLPARELHGQPDGQALTLAPPHPQSMGDLMAKHGIKLAPTADDGVTDPSLTLVSARPPLLSSTH